MVHGQAATAPAAPKREGYTFDGWDTDFSYVTEDLTVMARWCQNKPTPFGPVEIGSVHKIGGSKYVVTSKSTVSLLKAKSRKSFTLPAAVSISEQSFKVTGIKSKAFKGTKVKTLTVRTKKLTKKSVRGSLRNSKLRTVKVKVGKKQTNKKYVKKYRKYFTKKNCGKKVRVKR